MPTADASPLRLSFEAIGTAWTIESERALEGNLVLEIGNLIETFDRNWSRFREDSLISAIARKSGEYLLPPEATPLFELYRTLYDLSHGAITPLVGSALEALGYDKHYTLRAQAEAPSAIPAWDDAFSVKQGTLIAPRAVLVDIGAAGKGLLVDLIVEHLAQAGHSDFIVDASGDLRRVDSTGSRERVALENPANPTRAIGVVEIGSQSLAASGTNRRRWAANLHHVLDGITGLPATGVMASFVVAQQAMVADGVATALLVAEPGPFEEAFEIEWVTMSDTGIVRSSANFPGEVFS